jgi:hypothetical protein
MICKLHRHLFPKFIFTPLRWRKPTPKMKLMEVYFYNHLRESGKHIVTQRNCILPTHLVLCDPENKHRLFPKPYELFWLYNGHGINPLPDLFVIYLNVSLQSVAWFICLLLASFIMRKLGSWKCPTVKGHWSTTNTWGYAQTSACRSVTPLLQNPE